jgi:hypothetical protein
MTNHAADPDLARYQIEKQFDPKARQPETDPIIKATLGRIAEDYERRARATAEPTHAAFLVKAAGRLADAGIVLQSLEDRQQLRQKLNGCDLGTDHGRALHESIKQALPRQACGQGVRQEPAPRRLPARRRHWFRSGAPA